MNERPHKGGGNAFFLGMIVGGALVFLLGTKKGRKILKHLSENGLEVLENLENIEGVDEYEQDAGEKDAAQEAANPGEPKAETDDNGNGSSLGKRFFKGIKKKR